MKCNGDPINQFSDEFKQGLLNNYDAFNDQKSIYRNGYVLSQTRTEPLNFVQLIR